MLNGVDERNPNISKGIKGPRWRRPVKWEVKNTILMGQLCVKNIHLSEFAKVVGVAPRTVGSWIYEGKVPNSENMEKISEILEMPVEVLFREVMNEQIEK